MENEENKTPSKPDSVGGRGSDGKFLPGNHCSKGGNKMARKTRALRSTLLRSVNSKDMRQIIDVLITKAKKGNLIAIREIFDRVLGRPLEADIIEKVEALEQIITEYEAKINDKNGFNK